MSEGVREGESEGITNYFLLITSYFLLITPNS
jgi:hypothetical protein